MKRPNLHPGNRDEALRQFSLDEHARFAGGEVRVRSKIDPISYWFFGILGGSTRYRSKSVEGRPVLVWGFGN